MNLNYGPLRDSHTNWEPVLQEHVVGGFANGAGRGALARAAAHGGTGWAAGYSARMQAPGAEAVAEVRWPSCFASLAQ